MESEKIITSYKIHKYTYKSTHTTGFVQHFDRPAIGFIKAGSAKFLYKGQTYHATEGTLFYIAADTTYYSVWTGNPDIVYYTVFFSYASKYTMYDFRFQLIDNYDGKIFDEMYEERKHAPMLSIAHFYKVLNDVYKQLAPSVNSTAYIVIEPAIEYIEKNYSTPLRISTLARLCSCSESGLYHNFKDVTGVSPICYKHSILVQHAFDKLVNTQLTIDEISNTLGFSSSNYFRKVFVKLTGKSPTELRKKSTKK